MRTRVLFAIRMICRGSSAMLTEIQKRRSTAGVQKASVQPALDIAATFWSAAVFCRFGPAYQAKNLVWTLENQHVDKHARAGHFVAACADAPTLRNGHLFRDCGNVFKGALLSDPRSSRCSSHRPSQVCEGFSAAALSLGRGPEYRTFTNSSAKSRYIKHKP